MVDDSASFRWYENITVHFPWDYVGYIKDAEKILQREINEYRHEHHGPTIAVIECPNAQSMKSGIRALDDFPCVTIPSNARDSHYQVLGWQQEAAKIGMQRCAASSQWLNDRISLSRYAHVPVGNFELDWLVFTADLFFSRALCVMTKRDLFEWIELEPMNFWHSLLFMDQYNYGGIPAKADDIVPDESQVDIV